jgi:hypothetical protein
MLHSNTSNIESTFSRVHALGGCDARTYKTTIGCMNTGTALRAMDKSSSYSAADCTEVEPVSALQNFKTGYLKVMNRDIDKHRQEFLALFANRPAVVVNLFQPPRVQYSNWAF